MKIVNQEEPVARSRFIDCPSCKTHTLKLKRVVQVGRCKSCRESYRIVIVYVKEGRKPKSATKIAPANTVATPEPTLPSWQVPSDNSLFGSSPASTETSSIFSDAGYSLGQEDKNTETSTASEQ